MVGTLALGGAAAVAGIGTSLAVPGAWILVDGTIAFGLAGAGLGAIVGGTVGGIVGAISAASRLTR